MKKLSVYFSILLVTGSCSKNHPELQTSVVQINSADPVYCGIRTVSPPIIISDQDNIVIDKKIISNPTGVCIKLVNCNNVKITGCWLGPSLKQAIDIFNCTNVTVSGNHFDSVATGVYAHNSSAIKIIYNEAKNILGPMPRGQMVQFNKISGDSNRINYNSCLNILGESNPEDIISVYKSNGTPADPIQVIGNLIKGGGPSLSGGGINAGDGGSSSYIVVKDNKVVDPGQYGIAISGGTHITITDNFIFGKQQSFTNVGLSVWNQSTTTSSDNTVMDNKVNWRNGQGNINDCWNAGNCGIINGWSTNLVHANIDSSILRQEILSCHSR